MAKKWGLFLVVLITCMAAVFAGGSGESKSDSNSKVLEYWNINTEGSYKAIMDCALESYNANPVNGYTVEASPVVNDKYKEKLAIAMSSGQCPDIYSNWSGGPLFEYAESGFAQPLEDLLENSPIKDKVMPAGLQQATKDGHVYGVPYQNLTLVGVYYNKSIFDKYGFEEPKTIQELEHICEVLKADGIIPFALANRTKWTGSLYFMSLVNRYGGYEEVAAAEAGTGSFESECFIKAGEKIQDWVRKGYFPEGVNSLSEDDGQARQLIYREEAAMKVALANDIGTFKNEAPEFYAEKIGWFPFPYDENYPDVDPTIQVGSVGNQFITVNATGEAREAAFALIENHFTDASIQTAIDTGCIPPVIGIENKLSDPIQKKLVETVLGASAIQLYYDQYLPPAVSSVHLDTCQEIFGLTMTPQEAQAQMQAAMEKYNAGK